MLAMPSKQQAKINAMKKPVKVVKKKRRKKSKVYFGTPVQEAIIRYNESSNPAEKNKIYAEEVHAAFCKMAENLIHTFKFYYFDYPFEEVKNEVVSFLVMQMPKYEPSKGRAFSYFSVITKNWFIHKVKKNKKKIEREVPFEIAEIDPEVHFVDKSESFQDTQLRKEKIKELRKEMATWKIDFEKEKEKKVYDAVMILFDSVDDIEIFNKKAIYLYLREITGMNTKQIVSQLNKMRKKYKEFQTLWDNGEI